MAEILFVDDEPHILAALKRVFHGYENWSYHFANSPKEAIDIIAKHSITVLVSDHKMPQMTGADFLAGIKVRRPNTIRIMLTGQADLDAVKKAVNEGEIFRFVMKPWDDDQLKQTVREAVTFHDVAAENRRLNELTQKQNEQMRDLNASLEDQVNERTSQLSDALYTAQAINETLEQSLLACSHVFFSIVELARPDLGSHSRRVAEHAGAIGRLMGMTEREIKELETAALLHDVGKIGLPAFMLEKAIEDYDDAEFEIYKSHVVSGAESLKDVQGYKNVCKFIRQHHERYDGQGFPSRLKATDIAQEAYIIGIADLYDHLINLPGNDPEFIYQHTVQQIADSAKKAFKPQLVQVMLSYIESVYYDNRADAELRIGIQDLRPNMQLTRHVYSIGGTLLLAKGTTLTGSNIKRIRSIARVDPLAGEIFIATRKHDNQKTHGEAIVT